jgi:DNA transformation protein and related proteins
LKVNGKAKPSLANPPNLGAKSQEILAGVGITSVEQLRDLGSIAAFVQIKRSGANVSLNLLWALGAALTGLHWQEVARNHRTSLLLTLEEYEKAMIISE